MNKISGFKDTIKWYDENPSGYSKASKNYFYMPALDKFSLLLSSNAKVLDAGCASGRDSILLKNKGFDITGVDISVGLLKEAKKEFPKINFVYGDFLNLPFAESTFDGIWAHASLVHLETPEDTEKALSEFNRVLKPGGILHIFVKEQLSDKKTDVVSDKLSKHDRFFQYYKKEEMEKMLESNGFEVIFIENKVDDPSGRPEVKWIWVLAKKKENKA